MTAKRKPSAATPIIVAGIILALLLIAYLAGYYCLATSIDGVWETPTGDLPMTHRYYERSGMTTFFAPAGWLEARCRRRVIMLDHGVERAQVFYPT